VPVHRASGFRIRPEKKLRLAEGGLQVVGPDRLLVEAGEEGAIDPVRVPALQEAQDEDFFPADFRHTLLVAMRRVLSPMNWAQRKQKLQ